MIIKNILLNILALFAILSSILVITAKNPVISVLYLISLFINTAGYLIILGIGFVGIAYILVYIGAITVLFLFVIMMINIKLVDILEVGKEYTKNLPLALSIGFVFLYLIFAISSPSPHFVEGAGESTINNSNFVIIDIFAYPLDTINYLNQLFLSNGTSSPLWGGLDLQVTPGAENLFNGFITDFHSLINPINLDVNFTQLLQIEMLGQGLYTYGAY